MFSHLFRRLKFYFTLCVALLALIFAAVNREFVDVSLFPLPYALTLPKFLLMIAGFGIGLLVGGMLMSARLGKAWRIYKKSEARVAALENEVRSLRSSQHALPR